nr:MAG TPA: tail protein [Caudoviricetes sp.]
MLAPTRLDSIQRPFEFQGSITELLQQIITTHNAQVDAAKQFLLGTVTVTDPNDYIVRSEADYLPSWDIIQKKLIDPLGGYIWVRHEADGNYIDYLKDFNVKGNQPVQFGLNLIDLKQLVNGADIATVVIPVGSEGLTVEEVNNGLDYIENTDAIALYGRIAKVQKWDDVTLAANLLTKGTEWITQAGKLPNRIELSAADLSAAGYEYNSFHIGTYVNVISKPHEIDQLFLVNKLSISFLNPAANKLVLGGVREVLTAHFSDFSGKQKELINQTEKTAEKLVNTVYDLERNIQSFVQQAEDNIMQSVSERVYLKDETDRLVSEVSSSLEQTAEGFEMQFTEFNASLEDLTAGTDAEFELIRKYIRFVDGSILLGEVGNELELQISNDRISFLQGGAEVAYFSNNKLHVTDGQFINSLQLGEFAFIPRNNGNLSFKKLNSGTESS